MLLHTTNVPDRLPFLSILLSIGLSFHVLQSLSYIIEVYRGHYPAEHHAGYFALYVMYYPQLVAGPIKTQRMIENYIRPGGYKQDLTELADYCKKRGIKLTFVVFPTHRDLRGNVEEHRARIRRSSGSDRRYPSDL